MRSLEGIIATVFALFVVSCGPELYTTARGQKIYCPAGQSPTSSDCGPCECNSDSDCGDSAPYCVDSCFCVECRFDLDCDNQYAECERTTNLTTGRGGADCRDLLVCRSDSDCSFNPDLTCSSGETPLCVDVPFGPTPFYERCQCVSTK